MITEGYGAFASGFEPSRELIAILRDAAAQWASAARRRNYNTYAGGVRDGLVTAAKVIEIVASGMQLRENSRSEVEAEGLQPGPKGTPKAHPINNQVSRMGRL